MKLQTDIRKLLERVDKGKDFIGFDLDGVLAMDTRGTYPEIGEPNPYWVTLFCQLKEEGYDCRIFTARVSGSQFAQEGKIIEWAGKNGLGKLQPKWDILSEKFPAMALYFDDRAVGVVTNTCYTHIVPDMEPVTNSSPSLTVPEILEKAAETYRQRNAIYGDNYKEHGRLMAALFPNGLTLKTEEDWIRFGVLHMCIHKVGRYCNANGHKDSAHDLSVYAAMLEEVTK